MISHWIKAARLRTLPLSLSGILLGSGLAALHGHWNNLIFVLACTTTILFQVLSNFANDYGDGVKGTDAHRLGPKRTIQEGWISPSMMRKAIASLVIISFVSAISLIIISFGLHRWAWILTFSLLSLACIWAAIRYTVGKNAYGYHGMGDIFVFVFFGWLSVLGSYCLYTHTLSLSLLFPASSIGLLSVCVLNMNNMRDLESDKLASKHTLVVKIGWRKALYYHTFLIIMPFILLTFYIVWSNPSLLHFICLLFFIPLFIHLWRVWKTTHAYALDRELKLIALNTFFISLTMPLSLLFF